MVSFSRQAYVFFFSRVCTYNSSTWLVWAYLTMDRWLCAYCRWIRRWFEVEDRVLYCYNAQDQDGSKVKRAAVLYQASVKVQYVYMYSGVRGPFNFPVFSTNTILLSVGKEQHLKGRARPYTRPYHMLLYNNVFSLPGTDCCHVLRPCCMFVAMYCCCDVL